MKEKMITISINKDKFIDYEYYIHRNTIKYDEIKKVLIPVPFSLQQREEILDKIKQILLEI